MDFSAVMQYKLFLSLLKFLQSENNRIVKILCYNKNYNYN